MLKYNNNHIFTGYLKHLLSSFNLPTCKIYTREFAKHLEATGREDPRILKSFDSYENKKLTESVRVGYLKNDGVFNYYCKKIDNKIQSSCNWQRASDAFYSPEKSVEGLTRTLTSPGSSYDVTTHKYLGEYLRFIRDYYNINLMSMYNCFSDEICSNISIVSPAVINSLDSSYKIYKIPVKLFADYTIAIESPGSVELFCGLYNSVLDNTAGACQELIKRTYQRVTGTLFSQPFLYNKLNVKFWYKKPNNNESKVLKQDDIKELDNYCWSIAAREQDLYLFIKVPASCKSSIVVLEGDYREYNSSRYVPSKKTVDNISKTVWEYIHNKTILNFSNNIDLNNYEFKPISRLQLLAFNTGESYPFADRLIEYLAGSAITPMDDIHDNISRAQRVMAQNNNFFKIEGLWEEKMQNILYDYMTSSGEIKLATVNICDDKDDELYGKEVDEDYPGSKRQKQVLKDAREGYHRPLGHTTKSLLFDILGYVDKDTEKTYASYTKKPDKQGKLTVQVENTIQNVDIYNGLYDI